VTCSNQRRCGVPA